jgi:hypothetical protein
VLAPDPATPITPQLLDRAKDILIDRQDTHLDSLAERLRAIIQPILAGEELPDTPEDDRRFVLDLGLVRRSPQGGLVIAWTLTAGGQSTAARMPYEPLR